MFTLKVLINILKQDQKRKKVVQRRARKPTGRVMDYDQTIITGHIYQNWLQNSVDIVRERKRKVILVC